MIQVVPDRLMASDWRFPIDIASYNQHPELTSVERLALTQALAHCSGKKGPMLPRELKQDLARLLQPLNDILGHLRGAQTAYCTFPLQLMMHGMNEHALSYWAWSEEEWVCLL